MLTIPIRRTCALLASVALLATVVSIPAAARVDDSTKSDRDYAITYYQDAADWIMVDAYVGKSNTRGDGQAPSSAPGANVFGVVDGVYFDCQTTDPAELRIAAGHARLKATLSEDVFPGSCPVPVSADIVWKALETMAKSKQNFWVPDGASCGEHATHYVTNGKFARATASGTINGETFEFDNDSTYISTGSKKVTKCVP